MLYGWIRAARWWWAGEIKAKLPVLCYRNSNISKKQTKKNSAVTTKSIIMVFLTKSKGLKILITINPITI
jgi:hypothetical protein